MRCEHCGGGAPADAVRCPSCGSPRLRADGRGGTSRVATGTRRSTGLWVAAGIVLVGFGGLLFTGVLGVFGAVAVLGETEAAPPPLADPWADIRARGALRVAADPAAAPFLAQRGDTYEGFEFALMSALAGEAGVPVQIVPGPFADLPAIVAAGRADLAIGQLAPESMSPLEPSISYLQYGYCLVGPTGAPFRALADLRGKRVAAYDDEAAGRLLRNALDHDWQHVPVHDYGYLDDIAAGKIDAMLYDCPLARHELAASRVGGRVGVLRSDLGVYTYNVGVPQPQRELRAAVNRVLVDLANGGLLHKLEERWLGARPAQEDEAVVVRAGETLEKVAVRALGDAARVGDLRAWNQDILGTEGETVYAGMRLRVKRAAD